MQRHGPLLTTMLARERQSADQSCILTFADIEPLRLHGPSVWCHAVLFAYLRYGPAWQTAPFLHPLRQAGHYDRGIYTDGSRRR